MRWEVLESIVLRLIYIGTLVDWHPLLGRKFKPSKDYIREDFPECKGPM